jgi:hypothetical protein
MDLVAHLHVVYAGERRLMDFHDLRQDWEEVLEAPSWKRPRIHLASLKVESGTWRVKHSEGESNVAQTYGNIRDYHRDMLRRLAELADMSHEEIHTRADRLLEGDGTDKDRDLAGLTLLWATEARLTTASPSLRSK